MGARGWSGARKGPRAKECRVALRCCKGKDSDLSQSLRKELSAADTLLFDVWPLELNENTFVWFQATR